MSEYFAANESGLANEDEFITETNNKNNNNNNTEEEEDGNVKGQEKDSKSKDTELVTEDECAKDEDETKKSNINKNVPGSALPLDWVQVGAEAGKRSSEQQERIHFPSDVYEYSIETTTDELVIVGTHGLKITHMGKDLYQTCSSQTMKTLVLRSHLIRTMEGLEGFQQLTTLELYDNQIGQIQNLNNDDKIQSTTTSTSTCTTIPDTSKDLLSYGLPGRTIEVLDLSYNVIRDMEPVKYCPNLIELYLANNKIKEIKGLSTLSKLRKVDLGANRIRLIPKRPTTKVDEQEPHQGEELPKSLEELWLGKNKIEMIQGLENLTNLRRLDVQANRLTTIEGLTSQVDTLEELYLSHNAIDNRGASQPTGLALPLSKITILDLSKNRITSTEPFAHLMLTLEELWLSSNDIKDFKDIEYIAAINQRQKQNCLQGIYLEFNPVAQEFEYRKRLAHLVGPTLETIDGIRITGYKSQPAAGEFVSLEDQLRKFQDLALERAKQQMQQQPAKPS